MRKRIIGSLLLLGLLTGCTSTYTYKTITALDQPLDPAKGVVVTTPLPGSYANQNFPESGTQTAQAIKTAAKEQTESVKTIPSNDKARIMAADPGSYGYLFYPEIKHWEERATEWSGIPDRITINLKIYDLKTKSMLGEYSYSGKSKWATFGGDHPQDLLPEPSRKTDESLYK